LAHLDSREDRGYDHWNHYSLHPIPVSRPAVGRTSVAVTCASCGEAVDVAVYSLPGVRRLRVRTLVLGLGELAAAGAVVYGSVQTFIAANLWLLAGILGFVAAVLLVVAGIGTTVAVFREDGARLVSSSERHRLREPGDDSDYWNTEPGEPVG
jgi:hypothetical protein